MQTMFSSSITSLSQILSSHVTSHISWQCFQHWNKKVIYLFVCLFSYYLQNFRLHLNSWFAVFLILSPLHLSSCRRRLRQHSSTGSYPLPAASFLPLGLLKLLPRSILSCHISLTANKLLTLLSVIKNRKAFSPLSCKPFFLLTTDSPKQILQTKNCSQTTDLTNGNQTNHYSTDRQTN